LSQLDAEDGILSTQQHPGQRCEFATVPAWQACCLSVSLAAWQQECCCSTFFEQQQGVSIATTGLAATATKATAAIIALKVFMKVRSDEGFQLLRRVPAANSEFYPRQCQQSE
jgi:hypothetical protein